MGLVNQGLVQAGLAPELIIEHRLGDFGLVRDFLNGRSRITAVGKLAQSRTQDLVARIEIHEFTER